MPGDQSDEELAAELRSQGLSEKEINAAIQFYQEMLKMSPEQRKYVFALAKQKWIKPSLKVTKKGSDDAGG